MRVQLTYANGMVTVLAVLVLGGTGAYAAIQVGEGIVGTKQLKNGRSHAEDDQRQRGGGTEGPDG